MTQKILEEFKEKVTWLQLQPFGDGRFEVFLDGKRLFSKLETRRFPEYEEVRTALQKAR